MECAICLSHIQTGQGSTEATVHTACGHDFHLACLLPCLEYRGVGCPICRQAVDADLVEAPRPWMLPQPRRGGSRGSGAAPTAATATALAEAAVATEIAESVLAEHDASRSLLDCPDDVRWYAEIAEAVARSLAEDAQHHAAGPTSSEGHHAPALPAFGGTAAAAATAGDVGPDPEALAGLEEAVVRIQNDSALLGNTSLDGSRRQLQSCRRRLEDQPRPNGAGSSTAGVIADLNVVDVVGIAHAVLRSLDEDAGTQ